MCRVYCPRGPRGPAGRELSKQITWSFCSRQIICSRLRFSRQQTLLASVSERLPGRSWESGLHLLQFSDMVVHGSPTQWPAPLRWSSQNEVEGEHRDHWKVPHANENLTNADVV